MSRASLDIARVAEIVAVGEDGSHAVRASGYRISSTVVLTANHVLARAAEVWLRFPFDPVGTGWERTHKIANTAPGVDLAFLAATSRPSIPPAQIGRIERGSGAFTWTSVGFPLFKLRRPADLPGEPNSEPFRDSEELHGTIHPLSNLREGTYSAHVASAIPDGTALGRIANAATPWEGISGAAVWVGDRIIGVISRHHLADGPATLAVAPIESMYFDESTIAEALARAAGLPTRLSALDIVPALARDASAVLGAHASQVRSFAPTELRDRAQEVDAFRDFCAGDDPYLWWQAEPWAGKTALASWVAANPIPGTEFISFFVTARRVDQADSGAYLTAVTEQLSAVAGRMASPIESSSGRYGEYLDLLAVASAAAASRGNRLVLMVDGLDEDRTTSGPSIAALLPQSAPDGMRVVVTSRPQPVIPVDVTEPHPLRHARIVILTASAHAKDLRKQANSELRAQLRSSELSLQILALVAASGGALAPQELAQLLNFARLARIPIALLQLQQTLESELGRTLQTVRAAGDPAFAYECEVVTFAHDTLREMTEHALADVLPHYANLVESWVDTFKAKQWPETTPHYPLTTYAHHLQAAGNWSRFAALALDADRQRRLRYVTGSDYHALTELRQLAEHHSSEGEPPLPLLAKLAINRGALEWESSGLPNEIPIGWAHAGDMRLAVLQARSLRPTWSGDVTHQLLKLAYANGDEPFVRELRKYAESIADLTVQSFGGESEADKQLSVLAEIALAVGDLEEVRRIAYQIDDQSSRHSYLRDIALATASTDVPGALKLVSELESRFQYSALAAMIAAARQVGNREALGKLLQAVSNVELTYVGDRLGAVVLAAVLAIDLASDVDRHVNKAFEVASWSVPWLGFASHVPSLCLAVRGTRHEPTARALLADYELWISTSDQVPRRFLADLAKCALRLNDVGWAISLIERSDDDQRKCDEAYYSATKYVASDGDMATAQILAAKIGDKFTQTKALLDAEVTNGARTNDIDVDLYIFDNSPADTLLTKLVKAKLLEGNLSDVKPLLDKIENGDTAVKLMATAARVAANAGDNANAAAWLRQAEEKVRVSVEWRRWQASGIAAVVAVERGSADAQPLLQRFQEFCRRAEGWRVSAVQHAACFAALSAGPALAEQLLEHLSGHEEAAQARTAIVEELAYLGALSPANALVAGFSNARTAWGRCVLLPWARGHAARAAQDSLERSLQRLLLVAEAEPNVDVTLNLLADGMVMANRIDTTSTVGRRMLAAAETRFAASGVHLLRGGLSAWTLLAQSRALTGDRHRSATMMDAVEQHAEQLAEIDSSDWLSNFANLAATCAALRDPLRASRIEESMSFMGSSFRQAFASSLADLGEFGMAEEAVSQAEEAAGATFGYESHANLAKAYAERSRFADAQRIMRSIPRRDRLLTVTMLAVHANAILAGDQQLAHRLLAELLDTDDWTAGLARIAWHNDEIKTAVLEELIDRTRNGR